MDDWYLDTPWTDLINTKLLGSGQAHAQTGTHKEFLLYNIKLHNRQKEFTETPVSRAGGRRQELSRPVQNGHEQSFWEDSHFLPSYRGGADPRLFILHKLLKPDT